MNIDVQMIEAKDGNEILEVIKDGQSFRLNSAYKPFAEAEKFAKQYNNLPEESVLLVFGFGNGIFADAIMKACGSNTRVIFYEPCKAIMDCVSKHLDLCSFCDNRKCTIVADESVSKQMKTAYSLAEFPKALKDIVLYHKRNKVSYCVLPKYKELFPTEYNQYMSTIELHLKVLQSDAYTAKIIGHIAVENNINILKYIPDSYCADSFVNIFPKDMPAVLVAAGPSLEKNIKALQQAKGRAFIVCVDTAIKYILKEDIIPDMIVTIDPRKELSLFDDERICGIPLAGVTDMSWKVVEKVQSKMLIIAGSQNPYIQKLYARAGHQLGKLQGGGSVATTAYLFCRYLGFGRLILVGQDLALTDNQMYAGQQKLSVDTFGRELIEVEGVCGNKVYTTDDYYFYLKWFEQRIDMYPEMQVIDATEGGAKINGTVIMSLQEALNAYAKETYDIEAMLAKIQPVYKKECRPAVVERIYQDRELYAGIIGDLERGLDLAKKGLQLVSGKEPKQAFECAQINKEMMDICDRYQNSDESFLIQREIDATDLEHYIRICDVEQTESPVQQYERMKEYFECVLQAAKSVKGLYDILF